MVTKVYESVKAIALCHNVTPTYEDGEINPEEAEADQAKEGKVVYQASSPDEVQSHIILNLPLQVMLYLIKVML